MNQGRFAQDVVIAHPGRVSPRLVAWSRRFLTPLLRMLHRPTLEGLEHLPTSGPFLLVANHSAGLGVAEIFCFAERFMAHFGTTRPLAGFALPLGFVVWPLSALHQQVGTIPSTYAAGRSALAAGVPILVFPGGDHETLRPVWQANRVDFGGRVGFLRLAREAGVPIVPMGIRGGAWTAPMLLRARWLAWALVLPRLIGQRRWGISLLGLLGAVGIAAWVPLDWPWQALLAWLWLGSPLTFLPMVPWTLRMRVGPPLSPAMLFGDAGDGAELGPALATVEAAVQGLVLAPSDVKTQTDTPP